MSNLSYNELKEAFERTKQIEGEYSEMSILHLQPGDIVVAYFNWNEIDVEQAANMHKALTQIIPEKVSAITMPDNTYLVAYDKTDFIKEMFFNMDQVLGRKEFIDALKTELCRIDGDDLK